MFTLFLVPELQNTMFKFIHTNINDSKITFRKKMLKKNVSVYKNQLKNRTSRFHFLKTLSYFPISKYDATFF